MSNNENNATPEKDESNTSPKSENSTSPESNVSQGTTSESTTSEKTSNGGSEYFHDEPTKSQKWQNKSTWKRGIAMIGYGFVSGFVRMAITLIAIFQFFAFLFTEQANKPLIKLGQSLNNYMYQINQFLTFNAEEYPFPFADWPERSVDIKKAEE